MKQLTLLLAAILIAFTSCEKEPTPGKGQLDPNAMITIRPGSSTRATIEGLTALGVVEQALNIKWQSHYFSNVYYEDAKDVARTFIEEHKDYNKPALLMWGTDIITQEGDYYRDMTYAFNVVITDINNDTIAYIPDNVISAARPLIESAYEDEDYNEVYRLFDEAFIFLPIE